MSHAKMSLHEQQMRHAGLTDPSSQPEPSSVPSSMFRDQNVRNQISVSCAGARRWRPADFLIHASMLADAMVRDSSMSHEHSPGIPRTADRRFCRSDRAGMSRSGPHEGGRTGTAKRPERAHRAQARRQRLSAQRGPWCARPAPSAEARRRRFRARRQHRQPRPGLRPGRQIGDAGSPGGMSPTCRRRQRAKVEAKTSPKDRGRPGRRRQM